MNLKEGDAGAKLERQRFGLRVAWGQLCCAENRSKIQDFK